MSLKFSERLRKLRDSKGLSLDELASITGLTGAHIGRLERGETRNPTQETITVLSKALEIDPGELLFGKPSSSQRPPGAFDAPKFVARDIPVIGMTRAGRGGFFDDSGMPIAEGQRMVHRPEWMTDPSAYALTVEGNSMSPMIEKGWIVYACPNHDVETGDLAIVRLKETDEVMVKKIRQIDGLWLLQSINPGYEPLAVKKKEILSIHKVCLIKPK